jgi:glycosyltransferase involved in cell wall biosynthesis
MERQSVNIIKILKLFKSINCINPEILQTWMYHSNILGGVIGKVLGVKNIIWTIHHSNVSTKNQKLFLFFIIRFGSILSGLIPDKIVYCSHKTRVVHESIGYKRDRGIVIENGYDIIKFAPNDELRKKFRKEFGFKESDFVVGVVARWDPLKDFKNLFDAMSIVWKDMANVILVCVGKDINAENKELQKLIHESGGKEKTLLLGIREDIPSIMNGIDMLVLSSRSEALPNVVGEALACGIPCVVTDVGDVRSLVGDNGRVAPVENAKMLAEQIIGCHRDIENIGKTIISEKCRKQIEKYFSLLKMVRSYATLWN